MADEAIRAAFRIQQGYCATMASPITARVCAALASVLSRDSRTGAAALDWPGEPTRDALPLRLVGGLHALHLHGADSALSGVFAGATTDPAEVAAVLARVLVAHDVALLPWLAGPPQTNEPGRSGALMAGLLEVARRHRSRLEVLEIGSSAGLNLLIDRYRFDLGGVRVGPADAAVTIRPEWRGPPPPAVAVGFAGVRGVDIQPIDVADEGALDRLRGYVWADAPERLDRLTAAAAMVRAAPVRLDRGDAADWLEARLGEAQEAGVTRVLMHSVVWQYLPPATATRIDAAMAAAAARASSDRPLAWVAMEPVRDAQRMEVRVRSWPGHDPGVVVALSHAHGAWVEGRGGVQPGGEGAAIRY